MSFDTSIMWRVNTHAQKEERSEVNDDSNKLNKHMKIKILKNLGQKVMIIVTFLTI